MTLPLTNNLRDWIPHLALDFIWQCAISEKSTIFHVGLLHFKVSACVCPEAYTIEVFRYGFQTVFHVSSLFFYPSSVFLLSI